jgi:hypothetical protein
MTEGFADPRMPGDRARPSLQGLPRPILASLLAIPVVFMVIGSAALFVTSARLHRQHTAPASWVQTSATIVQDPAANGTDPIVTFSERNGHVHRAVALVGKDVWNVGHVLPIAYNPDDPSDFRVVGTDEDDNWRDTALFGAFFCAMVPLYTLYWRERLKDFSPR